MFKTIEIKCGCYGESCDGSGIREDIDQGQVYTKQNAPTPDEIIVERCDGCDLYANDMEAALVRFHDVRWVVSKDGFHSAAAKNRRAMDIVPVFSPK